MENYKALEQLTTFENSVNAENAAAAFKKIAFGAGKSKLPSLLIQHDDGTEAENEDLKAKVTRLAEKVKKLEDELTNSVVNKNKLTEENN